MRAHLRFKKATFGYDRRAVLNEISLAVEPGEVLAIVGPNGVGKSTLIRAASGALPLLEGQVMVGSESLHQLLPSERARKVAVVPQAQAMPGLFPVESVVLMGRTPYLSWFENESEGDLQSAATAMHRAGVLDLAHRRVGELSGGEKQLVLIARALAQETPVLLLDEPTAHLDLQHQDTVLKLVRQLATNDRLSVLMTLHDLNLVARYADRVALLSNGSIRKMGTPEEVLTPDDLAEVYGIAIHVITHPIHGTPLILP